MKVLYLVRHAHSVKNIEGIKDWERPLSSKGIKTAHAIFGTLKAMQVYPGKIITSYAFRALNTALLLAHDIGYPLEGILIKEVIYNGNSKDILAFIKKQSDIYSSLMIVGHNPSLTKLYSLLTNENYILPKPSVSVINFDVNSWKEIKTGIPIGKTIVNA
jgi:phosphohistidine phosphatase